MNTAFSKYTNDEDTAIDLTETDTENDKVNQDQYGDASGRRGEKRKKPSCIEDEVGEGADVVRRSPRMKDGDVAMNKGKGKTMMKEDCKEGKGSKVKGKKKFATMRIRSSPKPLYCAIKALSDDQKKCINEMGFGNILKFEIVELPSRILFFVVNNFDDKEMVINLGSRRIEITSQVIHQILGIPWGGKKLCSTKGKHDDSAVYHYQFLH